jgi:Tfp pilus assembly protein PilF
MPLDPLRYPRVLVEVGALRRAEAEIAEVLDRDPENLEALSLFAKIKHIRGELSLAIACQAQLDSKHPGSGERARMLLESMLHLAQDPERAAGEFLAVGRTQLVQKPNKYLALEEAFRLYLSRHPNEARGVCRRVAQQNRESDRELYRLANLAESWIYELVGDLPAAAEVLERLGQERGFETDLDRLLSLVQLYERLGSRDKLEAAVNICRYLEEKEPTTDVLGRLATLHHRLGHAELASEYHARHLAAYRRAMERPDFPEVLTVATEHHIPIERLRRIALPADDATNGGPRGRAIAAALRGDLAAARELLTPPAELLDLKYLAEVEALGSDTSERAIQLHIEALKADPEDLEVIGWLLDRAGGKERGVWRAFTELLRDPTTGPRVLERLEAAARTSPGDPLHWKRLVAFFQLQPKGEAQARPFREREAAVERAAQERARAIGRVLAAALYRFVGRPHGLIHEVWVSRELASPGRGGALRREDILGTMTDQMRDDVRSTFAAVREYAQSRFPHSAKDLLDFNYSFKITKDDEPSGGTSAGLPTALAFLSLFLQRPIPQDVAFTGAVITDAHDVINVRPVGDIEHKVDAAYHRNLRMIVVPSGNRPQLEQSSRVPRAVVQEIVRYVSSLEDVTTLVFGEDAYV